LIAISGGGGVNLFNSQATLDRGLSHRSRAKLDVDLRQQHRAAARAKIGPMSA